MALESNLALALFMIGLNLLIYQLKQKKAHWLMSLATSLFFGLTIYTYVAYRLVIILLILLLILVWFSQRHWRQTLMITVVGLILFALPWMTQLFNGSGSVRFNQLLIDQRVGINAFLLDKHNFCFLIDPNTLHKVCRHTFTYPIAFMRHFGQNYLAALSPQFLFLKGDALPYLHAPGYGQLLFILAPFYIFGLVFWFMRRTDKLSRLIFAIFLLSPIPTVIVGTPQAVRLSVLLPFVILLTAFGLKHSFWLIKNSHWRLISIIVYSLAYLFLTFRFLLDFLFIYPLQKESQFYPIGRQVARDVAAQKNNYDLIYVTDDFPDAHILFAFWNHIDPRWYQENIRRPDADKYGFQHPYQLGKFRFGPRKGATFLKQKTQERVLYITGATDPIQATKLFKGFSRVHTQAKVTDMQKLKQKLKMRSKSKYTH